MTIAIKNCGLKTAEAIEAAISSGAEYLGFIHHPASPRHIEPVHVAELLRPQHQLPSTVAVLVNPDDALIASLGAYNPTMLQLHGDETPERVAAIKAQTGKRIIKAISVSGAEDIEQAQAYAESADYLLLDSKITGQRGGTGVAFDWALLENIRLPLPWFLSGGLKIDNVREAVNITGATMLDVSSGLESAHGVKDPAKITAFNQLVKSW